MISLSLTREYISMAYLDRVLNLFQSSAHSIEEKDCLEYGIANSTFVQEIIDRHFA